MSFSRNNWFLSNTYSLFQSKLFNTVYPPFSERVYNYFRKTICMVMISMKASTKIVKFIVLGQGLRSRTLAMQSRYMDDGKAYQNYFKYYILSDSVSLILSLKVWFSSYKCYIFILLSYKWNKVEIIVLIISILLQSYCILGSINIRINNVYKLRSN